MNAAPARKLFSVREYDELIAAGFFTGKKRVELLEGKLLEKTVQSDTHIGTINRLNTFLTPAVFDKAIISIHNLILINSFSAPEPDVAVLRFREDFYSTSKAAPEDILLLIEVSDSTVRFDRSVKMPLYAKAGIAESWIVNLPRKILEVHRNPNGGRYEVVQKLGRNEIISPLAFPDLSLKIADVIG